MTIDNAYSTPARDYCRRIAKEIRALETLFKDFKSFDVDLPEDSRELLMDLAREADEDWENYTPAVKDYINLCCLEMTVLAQRSTDVTEWKIIGARLLMTYGGPNTTIEWLESDHIEVKVRWAGETAIQYVLAPLTATAIAELANA